MSAEYSAETIPFIDVLGLLDSEFRSFAEGVADGKYLFWAGAGVSRRRMPPLCDLVIKIIEYLRSNADFDDARCPFNTALEEALALAQLSPAERRELDLTIPFQTNCSDAAKSMIGRLCNSYSKLLQIEIAGKPEDALLWEGMSVAEIYGDPDIEPDAEHYSMAALVNEGALLEIASANWDCLIEKAATELNGGEQPLAVCVKGEDFQTNANNPKLVKFHGCAKRALDTEAEYRPYLVATESQISSWMDSARFGPVVNHLTVAIGERPSLVLGLSLQDSNLRALFSKAKAQLPWKWPGDRPSYVFAEQTLQTSQKTVLQTVYGEENYNMDTRDAIVGGSHIKAFAGRLLVALLIFVVAAKAIRLAGLFAPVGNKVFQDWVACGINVVRDEVARSENGDASEFVRGLIRNFSHLTALVRHGEISDLTSHYPLTRRPLLAITATPDTLATRLPEIAVLVGVLGRGISNGLWKLSLSDDLSKASEMVKFNVGGRERKLFVASSFDAENNLDMSGRLDRKEASILVSAGPRGRILKRSSAGKYGRSLDEEKLIHINLTDLLSGAPAGDELLTRFRQEVVA